MSEPPPVHLDNWTARANCRGTGNQMFPPSEVDRSYQLEKAKKTCQACPVKGLCLQDALSRGERHGVWGGLTTPEREAYSGGAPIGVCTRCGLRYANGYRSGRCHPCTPLAQRRTPTQPALPPRPVAVWPHPAPPRAQRVLAAPTADPRCGTYAGARAHSKRGERVCLPCGEERRRLRREQAKHWGGVDLSTVEMAVNGNPPASLTRAERRAVAAQLLAQPVGWDEMARRMVCTRRTAERVVAKLRAAGRAVAITQPDQFAA